MPIGDPHWVLAGSLLHDLLLAYLAVIAEGSLLNKVFPSKKDFQTTLKFGLHPWTKRNGLTSMPSQDIFDLGQLLWHQHHKEVTCHITNRPSPPFNDCLMARSFIVKTNKLRRSEYSAHAYIYYQAIETTFMDTSILNLSTKNHQRSSTPSPPNYTDNMANPIPGQQAKVANFQLATFWPRKESIPKWPSPLSGLCSTSWLE